MHSNVEPKLDIEHIYQYYVTHVNLKIKHTQRFFLGDLELLFKTCLSKVLATLRLCYILLLYPFFGYIESLVLVRRFAVIFLLCVSWNFKTSFFYQLKEFKWEKNLDNLHHWFNIKHYIWSNYFRLYTHFSTFINCKF